MVCYAVSDLREVNLVKFFVYYCLKSSTKLISSPTLQGMLLHSDVVIGAFSVQCNSEKLCFLSSPKRTFLIYLPFACSKQQNLLKVASRHTVRCLSLCLFITTCTARSSDFNDFFHPLISSNVSLEHVHIHSANQFSVFVCSLSTQTLFNYVNRPRLLRTGKVWGKVTYSLVCSI